MTPANDSSLRAFLDAESDASAWHALDTLLTDDLGAMMRDAVARHLARSCQMADAVDDVMGEVRVKLTQRLWQLRAGHGEPIENIRAYGAVTAERMCYAFLRRQFPERTRLRNRLRYALTRHPRTTIDVAPHGAWMCRSTVSQIARRSAGGQALRDSPRSFAADHGIDPSSALPALAEALLVACGEPVEFDQFVDAVAGLLGVWDAPAVTSSADGTSPLDRMMDPAVLISAQLEQRASLQDVWAELVALPIRQRCALLLNLRDAEGGAALHLLPGTALVTHAGIAAALALTEQELADIWKNLPLDDLAIAARLGASRQQVINLRKAARARLARRLERRA